MQLDSIYFENYKAFRSKVEIEIRPLTILIGRNNSGKSVIARLPILIGQSLKPDIDSPVNIKPDELSFGGSFVDLIHNRNPHGSIALGATFLDTKNGNKWSFKSKIQHFDEYRLEIVHSFRLYHDENKILTLNWNGTDPINDRNTYTIEETQEICDVIFEGLFPIKMKRKNRNNVKPSPLSELINDARMRIDYYNCLKKIVYLGPFRKESQRLYTFSGSTPSNVGLLGGKAADLLADDFLRRKSVLLDEISKWFLEHYNGWELGINSHGDVFSIVIRKPESPSVEINIVDAGTGISQVLPIIVQRFYEKINKIGNSIEIVEQPELHLHPAAHGDLADLYIDTSNKFNAKFIVETHSENFLLRIRRRVADESLSKDKVIVYWVGDSKYGENEITKIYIDDKGNVTSWPEGVFSEDYQEVKEIKKSQGI